MRLVVTIEAILWADDPSTFVTRRIDRVDLRFGGIEGDRHFGLTAKADVRQKMYPRGTEIMNRRQLSIVSVEELAAVAERLGVEEIRPEWLGANVLLRGYPNLTQIPVGARLMLPSGGGILCEGENEPCVGPGKQIAQHYGDDKLAQRFVKAAYKSRGIVASVERPGLLQTGAQAQILLP